MDPSTTIVGVAAILLDERRRALLLLREDRPDIAFPGCWTLVGGHVRAHEPPDAAMRREMREEIGHTAPLTRWLRYERIDPGGIHVIQHLYYGFLAADTPIVLGEEIDYRWVAPEALDDYRIGFRFADKIRRLWRERLWQAA